VGAGPAGLYFAILAKRLDPDQAVTVIERGPEGTTYGWGVVFWDGLLEDLERTDPETARQVRENAFRWSDLVVRVDATPAVNEPGHGYSIRRQTLLSILTERARALEVELVFGREIEDVSELADSDLVVASDGVNSRLRQRSADHLGTTVVRGRNKYIWLGTSKVFNSFTFPFVHTQAGLIWAHAYGFDSGNSTFIVETSLDTWRGLGFDGLSPNESMRLLEGIFDASLDGHPLRPQVGTRDDTPWLEFQTVTNRSWHHGNLALIGDAAHTTHFTIGSGTRLALEDAIGLATQLREHADIPSALTAYGKQRSGDLIEAQRTARNSAHWFENVPRYIRHGTPELAELMSRRRSSFLRRMPPVLYLWLIHAGSRAPALTNLARRGVFGWRNLSRRWRRSR
jgi:anthraniloyl-CoA monooxygenase